MIRCINIDWLEIYAHEAADGTTRDADYFRENGYEVREREYGTRQYNQMFTIFDNVGEPLLEVRRDPKGASSLSGFSVLDERSCHIRLVNRTCYAPAAAQIMQNFCDKFGYLISRISRIDIALDFERFDYGDEPQKFVNRYLQGRYSKINQSNIRANGKDLWDGRFWNSLSWGSKTSQVSTKLYNKTLELSEHKDKPYIRQAWAAAGLVDDFVELTKRKPDGTIYKPSIWRLEFSIKSSVKKWYVIEDVHSGKKKIRSIHCTLEQFRDRTKLMEHFAGLCHHYFFFKHFEEGQRKDRCKDKKLFDFSQINTFYEVQHIATAKAETSALISLKSKLIIYRKLHQFGSEAKAIDSVLELIKQDELKRAASTPECRSELMALQMYISRRLMNLPTKSIEDELKFVQSILTLPDKIF